MLFKMHQRHGQKGFTLIELLIVVAIIGIIAAILIPNLIDAIQKAKQKRTVADVRNMGTAWMAWLTDQVSASAAGQVGVSDFDWVADFPDAISVDYSSVSAILEGSFLAAGVVGSNQFYLQKLEQFDGWGHPYDFTGNFNGVVSSTWPALINLTRAIAIRSCGRDGTEAVGGGCEGTSYPAATFLATNYDEDIVWSDGYFIRSPGGISVATDLSAP